MFLHLQGVGILRTAKEETSKGKRFQAEIAGKSSEQYVLNSSILFSQAVMGDLGSYI